MTKQAMKAVATPPGEPTKYVPLSDVELRQRDIDALNTKYEKLRTGYRDARAAAYGPMADQLDMIFHGTLAAWKTHVAAIKNKYPKPDLDALKVKKDLERKAIDAKYGIK